MMRCFFFVFVLIAFVKCNLPEAQSDDGKSKAVIDSVPVSIKDSLKRHFPILDLISTIRPEIRNRIERVYISKDCNQTKYTLGEFVFEGFNLLGDINRDGKLDSAFVLPPIAWCAFPGEDQEIDGDSYYFSDTSLPRLHTPSRCCHPSSIFSVGDIDDDGIDEIGEYQTSCVSRYKLLQLHTLKKGKWKNVGYVVYDLFYVDTSKTYAEHFRKVRKGIVDILEITDLRNDSTKDVRPIWRRFNL